MTTTYTAVPANHLPAGQADKEALVLETFEAAGMWLSSYISGLGALQVNIAFDPTIPSMASSPSSWVTLGDTKLMDGRSVTLQQPNTTAEILNGTDPNGQQPDIDVYVGTTNLDRFYRFDPTLADSADIPADRSDAFGVALHELLHGIAFTTWQGTESAARNFATPFDLFLTQADGRTFFTGKHAEGAFGGPVPLSNPHLGDAQSNALGQLTGAQTVMSNVAIPNGIRMTLDPVILGVLRDLGYTVRDTQAGFTGTEAGLNTVALARASSGWHVDHTLDLTWLDFDGVADYAYRLTNVQRLQFSDATVALDTGTGEHAGAAYRLYQAAFHRTPDSTGLGYWIAVLDGGHSLHDVAQAFIASDEFHSLYGTATTNADILARLYENVLHRPGDASGAAFWLHVLDTHAADLAEVVVQFSESAENVAALATIIGSGVAYHPYG